MYQTIPPITIAMKPSWAMSVTPAPESSVAFRIAANAIEQPKNSATVHERVVVFNER